MAIVAGIDEAGYGPLLGPLVVSRVEFELPDEHADANLWEVLRDSVTSRVSRRDRRLPIADSKKLHQPAAGIGAVECTALTMLRCADAQPRQFTELVQLMCPEVLSLLDGYPWYHRFQHELPASCDPALIATHANAVRRSLTRSGLRFAGGRSCILPAGQLNGLLDSTRNKAAVLWSLTARLIAEVLQRHRGQRLRVLVDRQGGRTNHANLLLTAFDHARLEVLDESRLISHYRLSLDDGTVATIEFRQSGENEYLPVALASIFSKYLRELFMVGFNRYWQEHVTVLRHTAGYYQDGQRFLRDIEPAVQRLVIDRRLLVRTR